MTITEQLDEYRRRLERFHEESRCPFCGNRTDKIISMYAGAGKIKMRCDCDHCGARSRFRIRISKKDGQDKNLQES